MKYYIRVYLGSTLIMTGRRTFGSSTNAIRAAEALIDTFNQIHISACVEVVLKTSGCRIWHDLTREAKDSLQSAEVAQS